MHVWTRTPIKFLKSIHSFIHAFIEKKDFNALILLHGPSRPSRYESIIKYYNILVLFKIAP